MNLEHDIIECLPLHKAHSGALECLVKCVFAERGASVVFVFVFGFAAFNVRIRLVIKFISASEVGGSTELLAEDFHSRRVRESNSSTMR